jgi:NAD+ diphosphatase
LIFTEPPTLSRSVHDRVAERREDAEWQKDAWERGRAVVVTPSYETAVASGPSLELRDCSSLPPDTERYFLGVHDDVPLFGVRLPRDLRAEEWSDLRSVGASLPDLDAGLLTTAVALAHWHDRHPRCPLCGTPTDIVRAGWTRLCPADGSEHFPRTDPAVIMLVHDGGDRCVLGRQATWPPGRFSILAGFVEPGESLEGAVIREVGEEVGLAVTDVTYSGSQPWPFPASLMLGYTARVTGSEELTLRDGELAEARWVTKDEIRSGEVVALPPPVSIAYRIIDDWLSS